MEGSTILDICNAGICIGCGVCAGICPQQCIELLIEDGKPTPFILNEKCSICGLCRRVCPQAGFDYKKYNGSAENFWIGNYRQLFTAQSRDEQLLKVATSGGIVTQLVTKLLEDKIYDGVFAVGSYCHKEVTCAEKFSNVEDLKNMPKSRYVMVSHENTLKYMRMNKENKIIIVATPCVVHGLINAIDLLKLNRDNYLLIGLFCDKTMTNEVFDYFEYVFGCGNKKLDKIHFRTKEVGGWPGGVRLFWENGSCTDLSNKERTRVKGYFQPEGCLYCLDKVNYLADISVGDNYIEESSNNKGTSSVILRSMIAVRIWEGYKQYFISDNETEKNIFLSQGLERRKDNAIYARYKGIDYILPDNVMPKEKNQYMVKKSYKKLIKNLERGKNRNYQYIYKKSRHNYKRLLATYYGILGKIKKFFGFFVV